ncbi:MAG: glycosyltransferase family 39 protein [Saprospiraceae bacterium]|nr:glycosyltransferase family 39 protein [Saprospiraceae bacterium]
MDKRYPLLFALLALLFFVPGLGGVHLFDWDEVNFAEISREMLVLDDYLRVHVNFKPFWEKPPFFFWLQSLAMHLFGVGEFAARLPNALCGVLTLPLLYQMGRKMYDTRFGIIWAGAYFGSVLPFLYFKSGIIDPWFNLFIFLGLYYFILFYWKKDGVAGMPLTWNRWSYLFAGGLIVGMGVLTKGPVAFLLAALTMGVYWVYRRFRFYVGVHHFLVFAVAASLVTLAWYGLETLRHGPWFINEFNRYQYRLFSTPDAGHKGFPGYHFVVLLLGCFPASVFAVRAFFRMPAEENEQRADFRRWMKMLFWVVLILFTIVKSKIVHYSSMCYFPLTFLAALAVYRISRREVPFHPALQVLMVLIGGIYLVATLGLPLLMPHAEALGQVFKDPFAQATLEADVDWSGWTLLPGAFLLLLLVWFFWTYHQGKKDQAFVQLFGGMGVFVMLTLYFIIGRVEAYSQRAAVEFFQEKSTEDAYLIPHGYKSYVHLFYGNKQPPANEKSYDKEWLLRGAVDKDVYVCTKVHKAHQMAEIPGMVEIGRKNGFVFFRRAAVPADAGQ